MMSFRTCVLTRSKNNLPRQLDAVRMYGNVPFVSLNSRANGVSNPSVFYRVSPPYSDLRLGRRNNITGELFLDDGTGRQCV
jgi:hypothetical protein